MPLEISAARRIATNLLSRHRLAAASLLLLASAALSAENSAPPLDIVKVEGVYTNEAIVIMPRRDAPKQRVSLSGLRIPGVISAKLGPLTAVRLTQRSDELQFDYLDAAGKSVHTEIVAKSSHSFVATSNHVSFSEKLGSNNDPEIGNATTHNTYRMSVDSNRKLTMEFTMNYKTHFLSLIPVSGQDRGVYLFTPAVGAAQR